MSLNLTLVVHSESLFYHYPSWQCAIMLSWHHQEAAFLRSPNKRSSTAGGVHLRDEHSVSFGSLSQIICLCFTLDWNMVTAPYLVISTWPVFYFTGHCLYKGGGGVCYIRNLVCNPSSSHWQASVVGKPESFRTSRSSICLLNYFVLLIKKKRVNRIISKILSKQKLLEATSWKTSQSLERFYCTTARDFTGSSWPSSSNSPQTATNKAYRK